MDARHCFADRYELLRPLGRGGMAEVHLGRDTRLGRTVAVKTLLPELARDPVSQARFRLQRGAIFYPPPILRSPKRQRCPSRLRHGTR